MRIAAVAVALLTACGSTWTGYARAPTVAERIEIDRVGAAWRRAGRPWTARSAEAVASVRIAVMPPEDVTGACYQPRVGACLSAGEPRTIVVQSGMPWRAYAAAVRHEALHLVHFAAHGFADRWHISPGTWERHDASDSVEWRSRPPSTE